MNTTTICREAGWQKTVFSLVLIEDGKCSYYELAKINAQGRVEVLETWQNTPEGAAAGKARAYDLAFADRIFGMQNTEYAIAKARR